MGVNGGAWLSDDEVYRYALRRTIGYGLFDGAYRDETVNFIMLNPSTATATEDDPTIRRCIGYAREWGFGALMVTNLFAYRATDPRDLKRATDPVGPENNAYVRKVAAESQLVVAAWGSHGAYRGRDATVRRLLDAIGVPLMCLTTTKSGHPGHPLYLRADLRPVHYTAHEPTDSGRHRDGQRESDPKEVTDTTTQTAGRAEGRGAGARDAHPHPLDLELSEGHGWPSNADWHRDRRPATRPSTQDEAARRANA